jgi:hypothetical protein
VLEEAKRVLHAGRLHQLAGRLGDRDVGCGSDYLQVIARLLLVSDG